MENKIVGNIKQRLKKAKENYSLLKKAACLLDKYLRNKLGCSD